MKREYGRESTHLRLTRKAFDLYNGSDFFTIYEHEIDIMDDDGWIVDTEYKYSYKALGGPESAPMTAEELNAELEALADSIAE